MIFSTRALALSATGIAAVVVGTVGIAHARSAPVEVPPAVYGLDPATPPEDPAVTETATQAKRVSVSFSNVPVSRVLDWLAKQDANFVVANSSLPSDLKITLNVKNQPISAVEHAIAAAMGGSWSNRDGISVFRKGGGFGSPFEFGVDDSDFYKSDAFKSLKSLPGGAQIWTGPNGKDFQFQLKGLEDLQKQFGPDFQKKFQDKFGPEFEKQMKDQFGPDFQKRIQDQFGPEFEKKMKDQFGPDFQKKIQDQFGPDFQKKIQDQFGPEFQKRIEEEVRKSGGKDGGDFMLLGHQNLDGLIGSLTPDQKAKMKAKGYLTPKDLTANQRKMLGSVGGQFELKVSTDKGSITIKND